jgi:hypothetical protein
MTKQVASAGVWMMGRPKKTAQRKPPLHEDEGKRETVIHMKGSAGYTAWLDDVHRKTHIPKVQIFRIAVAEWAERHGHTAPPEI